MDSALVPEERFVAAEKDGIAPHASEERILREGVRGARRRLAPVRGQLERGDARLVLFRQADPDLDAERPRDLLGEEAAGAAAVDPADQLAAEPAIAQRMIGDRGARIGARFLRGKDRGHPRIVGKVVDADRLVDARHPRRVRDKMTDQDVRLAEFGPIPAHRIVETELAALDQHQEADRHHALGAGKEQLERILPPRPRGLAVGEAAPKVDHQLAAAKGGKRGAELAELGEIPLEGLPYRFIARRDVSFRHLAFS